MKIHVLSDLHNEFLEWTPRPEALAAADVVVLAGDIHTGASGVGWAARHLRGKPTVYVAGNHEFYRGHWDKTLEDIRGEAAKAGIEFLEDDRVVLDGVRFLGCSLWTDFQYFGSGAAQQLAMNDYVAGLMDCRAINAGRVRGDGGYEAERLTPLHVLQRHNRSRAWLESALDEPFEGPTVVVTHHLPHRNSVAPRFANDRLTPGFAVDLPNQTIAKADLWIHGHTHDSCAYAVRDPNAVRECTVICNPMGYPLSTGAMENKRFDPHLLVQVGDGVHLLRGNA